MGAIKIVFYKFWGSHMMIWYNDNRNNIKQCKVFQDVGNILTINISKTINNIKNHLIYSKSLQSQIFFM